MLMWSLSVVYWPVIRYVWGMMLAPESDKYWWPRRESKLLWTNIRIIVCAVQSPAQNCIVILTEIICYLLHGPLQCGPKKYWLLFWVKKLSWTQIQSSRRNARGRAKNTSLLVFVLVTWILFPFKPLKVTWPKILTSAETLNCRS